MLWFILAPGPSMSAELAARVAGQNVCAVGNTFELAPAAQLLVATDAAWWRKHPAAHAFPGMKLSGSWVHGVKQVNPITFGTSSNSGVLALDAVRNLGAKRVVMLGFDMRGGHFFGPYTNGLRNTSLVQRQTHMRQFESWAAGNRGIEVTNCTPNSALKVFPTCKLESLLDGR